MKIFRTAQVREIDRYTIDHGPIASIDLMERASAKYTDWYVRKFDSSKAVTVIAGTGNNGGDGLAVARLLAGRGYRINVILIMFGKSLSADCEINLQRLEETSRVRITKIVGIKDFPDLNENTRIIDALFGSGLSRPVEGLPAEVISKINGSGCDVVSIDIPSGLFGEDNSQNNPDTIVRASYTLTFQFPFLSFFFPENEQYTGKWKVIPIGLHPDAIEKTMTDYQVADLAMIKSILKSKNLFAHKGTNGHALLIAGSYGMMGAAVLATKACLRSGAGLVTVHIPRIGYEIIQSTVPEALVSIDESDILFSGIGDTGKFSSIAAGPGLGCKPNTVKGIRKLLSEWKGPLLLDADAINILAGNPGMMDLLPASTILSPHPGEFDRLAGVSANSYERHLKQLELSSRYSIIIILKGHHSIISFPDGRSVINSTGNPGLATGGSGDVLTGIICSLLAQAYSPEDAAVLGVYLHGLAADLALEFQSEESMIPSDVIGQLGNAFKYIRVK